MGLSEVARRERAAWNFKSCFGEVLAVDFRVAGLQPRYPDGSQTQFTHDEGHSCRHSINWCVAGAGASYGGSMQGKENNPLRFLLILAPAVLLAISLVL